MAARRDQKTRRRIKTRRVLVGLFVVVFVILGIVFVIKTITDRIQIALDDSNDKQEYAQLYSAMVAMDPVPFNNIESADPNVLLEAAIWSAFLNEDSSSWPRNENGQLLINTNVIDRYAQAMYGPDYRLNHITFSDLQDPAVTFTYDAATETYALPITSLAGSLTPIVEDITVSGRTKTLRIAYMSTPTTELQQYSGDIGNGTVVKYMDYILIRTGGNYYLYSIQAVPDAIITPG